MNNIDLKIATQGDLDAVAALSREGKITEAVALATRLLETHANDSKYWIARATVYARSGDISAAVADAVKATECDSSNRNLYPWVCLLYIQLRDFKNCLKYADAGLAAQGGSWESKDMYEGQLVFLGARALYELGSPEAAINRVASISPDFGMGRRGDRLMDKASLVRACQALVRRQPS
jgi:tetratricopeptide (TPR) repeat protein